METLKEENWLYDPEEYGFVSRTLKARMDQGDYWEYGDWKITDAAYCYDWWTRMSGSDTIFQLFDSSTEPLCFNETFKPEATHAVLLEYTGESYPVEVWQEEKDKEIPVFYICPADMTDEEIWSEGTGRFVVGQGGSSSDGTGWEVPLVTEKGDTRFVDGGITGESIEEAMKLLDTPYELRIYTQKGERLETIPLQGGGLYE